MADYVPDKFYTSAGRLIADKLYIDQGWGRKGLGIERLCNELGELCARIEMLEQGQRIAAADRSVVKQAVTRDRDETGDFTVIHDAPTSAIPPPEPIDVDCSGSLVWPQVLDLGREVASLRAKVEAQDKQLAGLDAAVTQLGQATAEAFKQVKDALRLVIQP